jgi:hypothetical protein
VIVCRQPAIGDRLSQHCVWCVYGVGGEGDCVCVCGV